MNLLLAAALAASTAAAPELPRDPTRDFGLPRVQNFAWIAEDQLRPTPRMLGPVLQCLQTPTEGCLEAEWSSFLAGAGERRLSAPRGGASYRLVWVRSFHPYLIMRVDLRGRTGSVTAHWLDLEEKANARWRRVSAPLLSADVHRLQAALDERPIDALLPEVRREVPCADGADWTIEMVRGEGYRYVHRDCTLDEDIAPLAEAMIAIGRSKWPKAAWDPVY